MKKVKLTKCKGGVIIDGTPYGFEKQAGFQQQANGSTDGKLFDMPNMGDTVMAAIENEVRPQFTKLQELFTKPKNVFLSSDDIKLAKKQLTLCEKRINEVYVKAQNAQKML